MKKLTTEERLENALKHQPDRYLATRDKEGKLIEVQDADTGRVWQKIQNAKTKEIGWAWFE